MKIVVTGTRGIPNIMGGVETHCEELFPRIAANKDFDVTVIRRSSYVTKSISCYKNVDIVDISTPRKKAFEAIIHTFRAIFKAKKLGADIVHIHAIGPAIMTPLARLLGMKVVFTHHGPDYNRDKWGFVAKQILKLGERMGVMFANEVIVISEVINNLIKEKYNRQDCKLIYNGIPAPNRCDLPEYFKQLGIEKGKYVISTCRFVPEKNLHHLVEAFSRLAKTDYELVLVGDSDFEDDYSRELKQKAKENDVVLTGFIKGEKLYSLLTQAACFVLPSSHEGLPISLLEAMSYNLPVIVSNIPANLEVGLPDEVYFSVGDVDMLTARLQTVLSSKVSAVKYDMNKYDWDRIAEELMQLYKSLQTQKS